jgi:hypothetical protein
MIPITSDIIGPGIEEEYADAMMRITFLLDAFESARCLCRAWYFSRSSSKGRGMRRM